MRKLNELENTRHSALRMLTIVTVVVGAIPIIVAGTIGNSVFAIGGLAGMFALLAVASYKKGTGLAGRLGVTISLIGEIALLTAAFSGHAWQIDSHMTYFAGLAMVTLLVDPVALVVGAGVIALHHLALTFVMPSLIYPSTDLSANIERTLFHAAILVVETIILVVAARNTHAQLLTIQTDKSALTDAMSALEQEMAVIAEKDRAQTNVVTQLRTGLSEVESGNLRADITGPFPTEYEDLRKSFNETVNALNVAVSTVVSLSDGMRLSSGELAASSNQVAKSTEQQAETLARVSGAVVNISDAMKTSVDTTGRTQNRFDITRSAAENSAVIVERAVTAMDAIEESSGEINSIVSLIEDIAFQTNLLALNAGVEAARAGEAGAGFAIVASEVRALAYRSSEAAQNINRLIEQSGEQVSAGVVLVKEVGEALTGILTDVKEASESIVEIAKSARDQSDSVSEIRAALDTIEGITQSNAARSEEAFAATVGLEQSMDQLTNTLKRFDVGAQQNTAEQAAWNDDKESLSEDFAQFG